MPLDRSRSATCAILFRAFVIGSVFRYSAVCGEWFIEKNVFFPEKGIDFFMKSGIIYYTR